MPKRAKELNDRQVKALKHPGGPNSVLFAVGGVPGLHLQLTPNGSRPWILRMTSGAKRRDMGLGSFGDVSRDQARDAAYARRKSVKVRKEQARAGAQADELRAAVAALPPAAPLPPDPVTIHKKAKAATPRPRSSTFEESAKRNIRDHIENGTEGNKKHKAQWRSSLETYAFAPAIRTRIRAVPHGCRSTFRNGAGKQGYPRDLAEEALALTVGSALEAA